MPDPIIFSSLSNGPVDLTVFDSSVFASTPRRLFTMVGFIGKPGTPTGYGGDVTMAFGSTDPNAPTVHWRTTTPEEEAEWDRRLADRKAARRAEKRKRRRGMQRRSSR